jgi:hypothetical protein
MSKDATFAYVWGDKMLELHHCRTCGCTTHWTPIGQAYANRMGINARLMENFETIPVRKFDGASSWTYLDE